ncbi:MAG: hypothetical protein ACRDPM_13990 [Solirubrobacteraceae bacterium]
MSMDSAVAPERLTPAARRSMTGAMRVRRGGRTPAGVRSTS